jgi:hypothetical protein
MVGVTSSLGMFAADPRALEETDYIDYLETGDNVEDLTGEEYGWSSIVLEAKNILLTLGRFIYGIPYLVAMSFGTTGEMGIVVAGLITLFTFMYGWLALEIIRGMKI